MDKRRAYTQPLSDLPTVYKQQQPNALGPGPHVVLVQRVGAPLLATPLQFFLVHREGAHVGGVLCVCVCCCVCRVGLEAWACDVPPPSFKT